VRRVALGACPAPPAVALRLGVAPGEPLLHARRVRAADGVPFALLDSYTRWPRAAPLEADGLAATGRLELFRRAGVRIARATQALSAGLADETVAGLLGVAAGDALLHLERTLHAEDGEAFDHLVARYVPERFEYRIELSGPESFAGGAPADPPVPVDTPQTETRS
jgi:GntR family transcriptional regulator